LKNIISYFPKEELKEASEIFRKSKHSSFSGAGNSSSKAMLVSGVLRDSENIENGLWIVNDKGEQNMLRKALSLWGDRPVYIYKKRDEEERLSFPTSGDFERAKKIEAMEFVSKLYLEKNSVFVLNFDSILQKFPNIHLIAQEKVEVVVGEELDVVRFIQEVVAAGYEIADDQNVKKGEYYRVGDSLFLWAVNFKAPVRIEVGFTEVEKITEVREEEKISLKSFDIFPIDYTEEVDSVQDLLNEDCFIVDDEVDVVDDYYAVWNSFMEDATNSCKTLSFTSFNEDESSHKHLHFLSVLKYRGGYDLANDLKDKINGGWRMLFFTKHIDETRGLLVDQGVAFLEGLSRDNFDRSSVFLVDVEKEDVFPQSFQTPQQKILLISDVDISLIREAKRRSGEKNIFNDFLTSLKPGDYVVHSDHGVAKFLGLDRKTIDEITKEYLKLGYAENDKLFVPFDQADKVNKYIGSADVMPKLTRLGSAEWNTLTSRVKKETQKIAKELLKLYAERKAAVGHKFVKDSDTQRLFEETFPYDETPGQIKAIDDVKGDMESELPMDRLVCGDVGFGKTEVAMRAAFKSVQDKKQVAIISPITILADQHYKSFKKRMESFHVRVEMLSRFKTASEQKVILKQLERGEIDVIIGTHRLIQPDVKFKNLGLVVIDEEQRFGVKQKEKLKELRKEVDILTLTATPIPRTLNICLNKLRDITTITTPPYGRLPIITEVRKYSPSLVREAILKEISRDGQVYFLHNRVQTIDGFADKLKELVPEAKFIVAHGKLGSGDLEERIMAFKEGKYNVLVSSTIIENGIDLSNANTLIVNNAEKFGLSQLYQLRGRVGRGKNQAYAYFLYHGQRLKLDAKKRLRAIVEASELGSGFQIAMKDLEIRGAGDILGANQHGVINVVGVSHFMRMLNKSVEDLKAGRVMEGTDEIEDVSIELPIPAFIPDDYVPDAKDKINSYQRLSSADSMEYLKEIEGEFVEDYGKMPREVKNLFRIIELKIMAKSAGILNVKAETVPMSKGKEIVLYMSGRVKPANIINLLEDNNMWAITGSKLRINIRDLGEKWFEGLRESLDALSEKAKHGAKKKGK